ADRSFADDGNVIREITLDESLVHALQTGSLLREIGGRILQSPDSVASAVDPEISRYDPFFGAAAALAEFDDQLSMSSNIQNNDRVFNNLVLGGNAQQLTQDLAELRAGWSRRNRLGGTIQFDLLSGYDANNRSNNLFPSIYEKQATLTLRQPLLRGAGLTFNEIAGPNARPGFNFSNGIRIARINEQISKQEFATRLDQFIEEIEDAYWRLYQAQVEYDAAAKARDLAYQVWQTTRSRMQSGLEGGEADREAAAAARFYQLEQRALRAIGDSRDAGAATDGVLAAEQALRYLIGWSPDDPMQLRSVDQVSQATRTFDVDAMIDCCTSSHPAVQRQQSVLKKRQMELVAAKNFLLPQLDGTVAYRVRGFGDDLWGSRSQPFDSANAELHRFDYQEWEFGLSYSQSPQRRQAAAAVRHARLRLQREHAVMHTLTQELQRRVRNSVHSIQSNAAALRAAKNAAVATENRLQASRAQFDAGRIDLERLLDALQANVDAQSDVARVRVAHAKALSTLQRLCD
ncbi:MAG: TolC family protein, partial [Planctomycetota bacterium]